MPIKCAELCTSQVKAKHSPVADLETLYKQQKKTKAEL